LVYMMATIALLGTVLRTLWTAVYAYVRAVYQGQPVVVDAWMISWFAVAAVLCAAATALPLWVGLRRMERFEFYVERIVEPRPGGRFSCPPTNAWSKLKS